MINKTNSTINKGGDLIARKKQPELFEKNRERIIGVSKILFLENGIENTKMDDIAKAANMSKSTLYVYFRSKEEIVLCISLEAMKYLRNQLDYNTTNENMSFKDKYIAIGHVFEGMKEKYPLSFNLVSSPIDVDENALNSNALLREIYDVGEQINQLIYNCFSKLKAVMEDKQLFAFVFRQWGCIYGLIELTWNKQEYLFKSVEMTRTEYLDTVFENMYMELELVYSLK